MRGILLFAHGSRDPEWAKPFDRLIETTRNTHPELPLSLAYLEKMQPDFFKGAGSLVQAQCTTITILPLFLARGGHLKHDLNQLQHEAEKRWPNINWITAACIGDSPFMQAAMVNWIHTHS